ncbi:MAG: LysM peptidoglycan-binding domain-containing protein, partial [Gammaproteobacteria bacterium]|nr:LysM peptidoglycan-binding domain-containing protein [Gammaproteobacteria bacterium]
MMNNKKQRYFILLFICLVASLLNSSCSSNSVAPVSTRSGNHDKQAEKVVAKARATPSKVVDKKKYHHIVVSGDTLFSISWNYDLDYKEVARWNNIKKPYVIHPRQSIRLTRPPTKKTVVKKTILADKKAVGKGPEAVKKRTKTVEPVKYARKITWRWPTTGKLV